MIVGQEHIISLIDKSTVDTFPKSLILLGEYGSGKHTISDYISNRLNLTTPELAKKYLDLKVDAITSNRAAWLQDMFR